MSRSGGIYGNFWTSIINYMFRIEMLQARERLEEFDSRDFFKNKKNEPHALKGMINSQKVNPLSYSYICSSLITPLSIHEF